VPSSLLLGFFGGCVLQRVSRSQVERRLAGPYEEKLAQVQQQNQELSARLEQLNREKQLLTQQVAEAKKDAAEATDGRGGLAQAAGEEKASVQQITGSGERRGAPSPRRKPPAVRQPPKPTASAPGSHAPAYMLACIDEGYYVEHGSTLEKRYDYLTRELAQDFQTTQMRVADCSVTAQNLLRDEYGVNVKVMVILEDARQFAGLGLSVEEALALVVGAHK